MTDEQEPAATVTATPFPTHVVDAGKVFQDALVAEMAEQRKNVPDGLNDANYNERASFIATWTNIGIGMACEMYGAIFPADVDLAFQTAWQNIFRPENRVQSGELN